MAKLPVITGFGGINAAGRSAGHHGYRRMTLDALSGEKSHETLRSLATLSGLLRFENGQWLDSSDQVVDPDAFITDNAESIRQSSLIRQLEKNLFDPDNLLFNRKANLSIPEGEALQFQMNRKHLPSPLPPGWTVTEEGSGNKVTISASEHFDVMLNCHRKAAVNSAGQLPSGFDPSALYASRNHPRALQLTVFAASDAINSLGIDWEDIKQRVSPDKISVYAGSGLGQMDYNGYGGMMQARLLGKKVSSKQLALGYAEMPADFINAYLLGSLGTTGTNVAACATFLYNLRQGIRDIQSGTHRVVIVGTSEAPLVPEVFDGFATMGALADDASLRELDKLAEGENPDFRRACRPFGFNAGFTLAESAQCVVLFDDELALEMGATIYGSVNEVFINADGFKKSIASPGLGNYISMAKAAAATKNIIGEEGLRHRSYVQAHGTGTLQNRQTESHILNHIAESFGISNWPIAAVKSYVGHSLASSAGDQLAASLGVWEEGIIPGILTVPELADDVHSSNIDFLLNHKEVGKQGIDAVILNSKGFGGNNASASVLSPHITKQMLEKRHGSNAWKEYQNKNEAVQESSAAYDASAQQGANSIIYKFDHGVLNHEAIEIRKDSIHIKGIDPEISLSIANNYEDMCDD
ncbi:MAG: beta-ketoacyl synthase [Gammaproteobacteria bacterium]|jgi:acetoacetyl-[acyl-carrier protein] synthase|nr:beta-ketoacyl synthase [Gammaproteobacteria bacterium]MBT3858888.1 beta-ketoacyl synthase [Gammaproteobacteria bacterium]MBT3988216.1 beta-ketoacyl synthase [Gammaproteobacteria bacterium]MBT4255243.1 beta-ketoacyl synthase [Gammaproteobacteria bacterium]MBT4582486.1 beta-ketoacyl synthase [Gammaproteobacteria bacterium]